MEKIAHNSVVHPQPKDLLTRKSQEGKLPISFWQLRLTSGGPKEPPSKEGEQKPVENP
jgi:hypothetical protein